MVALVNGTTLEVDNTGEAVHVLDSGDSGDFSSETVASNSCHGDLVLIHESHNILAHLLQIVRVVMVRLTLVTVVEQPNIALVSDLVALSVEEAREVGSRFEDVSEPDHDWLVNATGGEEGSSQLDVLSVALYLGTYSTDSKIRERLLDLPKKRKGLAPIVNRELLCARSTLLYELANIIVFIIISVK